MLTKNDLKQIEGVVQKSNKAAFAEFYDSIFEPHVERSEREHAEIKSEVQGIGKDMDEVKEFIKDHEHRLDRVEVLTSIKN